jgi:hypothetical protein
MHIQLRSILPIFVTEAENNIPSQSSDTEFTEAEVCLDPEGERRRRPFSKFYEC